MLFPTQSNTYQSGGTGSSRGLGDIIGGALGDWFRTQGANKQAELQAQTQIATVTAQSNAAVAAQGKIAEQLKYLGIAAVAAVGLLVLIRRSRA